MSAEGIPVWASNLDHGMVRWQNNNLQVHPEPLVEYLAFPAPVGVALRAVAEAAETLRVRNDDLMERQEEYPDDAYIEAWVTFSNALDNYRAAQEQAT